GILPLKDISKSIQIVSLDADRETYFQQLSKKYTQTQNLQIPLGSTLDNAKGILRSLDSTQTVILGLHLQNIRPAASFGLNEKNLEILSHILSKYKTVLCVFGNTYALEKIKNIHKAEAIILLGQGGKFTEEAASMAVFGAIPSTGKLPVRIGNYALGTGVNTESLDRLKYRLPELENISSTLLSSRVDSVINEGLKAKAFPGGVVQVVKNGSVIYSKSYGFHTYEEAERNKKYLRAKPSVEKMDQSEAMDYFGKISPIANSGLLPPIYPKKQGETVLEDIFDLASITKVSTAALAILQLQSEGKFDLDKTLSDYLPEAKNTNKAQLKFRDMLTHRSGLKAWIPFWRDCVDTTATLQAAIKQNIILDDSLDKVIHKKTFFQKILHKKAKFHFDYISSLAKNKNLWNKALQPTTIAWKKNTFSTSKSEEFPVQVHDSLYLHKDYKRFVWKQILDSPVNPNQGYVYSDLHYYFYPQIIQNITGMDYPSYLKKSYASLGAHTLGYKPRSRFEKEQIVPTEKDPLFRKNLIHGYVHDEGAGMLDGISGHAGLFGSVNDLSKLIQMYLQKGEFGGQHYFDSKLFAQFSDYQFPYEGNRRAIAFDKLDFDKKIINGPRMASELSFGHSGFTGTFVWIDPKYDVQYIFLSNRVYPTRDNTLISTMNLRSAIGDQIIRTIKDSK
ncbi:MAG: serine hydrolase domain-containing protein, partial [Leadbetterella sp.]